MAAPRSCGTCSLCCKLLSVGEIGKQKGTWCPHCRVGRGCGIYDTRPTACRTFRCAWLAVPQLGEHWFPGQCRMVLSSEPEAARLVVRVDPARPDAWRQQPFYDEIRSWAARVVPAGEQVCVMVGDRLTVVLPDSEVDLGKVSPEDGVLTERRDTPTGPRWVAERIPAGDPRMAGAAPGSAA